MKKWLGFGVCLFISVLVASLGSAQDTQEAPVRDLLQHPVTDEILYFLMPDRFNDGDPANNCGDFGGECVADASEAEVLEHGYLPSNKGYYHGGDIAGLMDKLDYLEGLGVTALWVAPIFKNKPVQVDSSSLYGHSSAYHGYWITDFMNVDPHFGSNEDFRALVDAAHRRGIKVFMDIITNHTADVIQYEDGDGSYRSKNSFPYEDETGESFDDDVFAYEGQADYNFPPMDEAGFPYDPDVTQAEQEVKNPSWLNNPLLYHNRGNSTFTGENSLYGDFFGLDDLFTERKEVVDGMIDIYKFWIEEFGVDGFRIDTTKHVNIEFWQVFGPAIQEAATDAGIEHFFAFGEVFDGQFGPPFLSYFSTVGKLPATIDFAFQGAARGFASQSEATDALRDFFALDDYYTDADSNAYAMPTFLGNHDMGRIGFFLQLKDQLLASDEELLKRSQLAHALMFFARGQPVIYYGDEQGFTGDGGDKDARQDMFTNRVAVYADNDPIGSDATNDLDNFDTSHPLYETLATYADLYKSHAALRGGAQVHRYSTDSPGIYAFSRIHRDERLEFIVALNNEPDAAQSASVPTYYGEGVSFTRLLGDETSSEILTTDANGNLDIDVAALGTVIYVAETSLLESDAAPEIAIRGLENNQTLTLETNSWDGHSVPDRIEVAAELSPETYVEVTFAVRVDGGNYAYIGTDANPPYRVFYDASELADGAVFEFAASVSDLNGHVNTATVSGLTLSSGEPTTYTATYPYAVIHYSRPDGGYGSVEDGDYWGVHTWGDAPKPGQGENVWETPIPFIGEDDFGRFAFFNLADSAAPFNFIIHTPSGDEVPGTREPGGDRSFIPNETPEVWIVQGDETVYGSRAEAQGHITLHYQNEQDDYSDITLSLSSGGNQVLSNLAPESVDDYGAVFRVSEEDGIDFTQPVNVTVHRGTMSELEDLSFTPADNLASVYLREGKAAAYPSLAAVENKVVLYYHRPNGDYGDYEADDFAQFWGVHTWTGAAIPTEWQTPVKASGQDAFGVYFEIPLAEGANELAYIIHRGDNKDPGPDQILNLDTYGYKVWQASEANPETPYILPVPKLR